MLRLREIDQTTIARRDAVPRPNTFDRSNLTIEATIASATPVPRVDGRGPYNEILDIGGVDLAAMRGVSVLNSHQQNGLDAVIGVVDDAWRDGDELVARIRLSPRDDVAPWVEDIAAGLIRFLSVGYQVEQWTDGRDSTGARTRTAARWAVREVSFVPVPADPSARTRAREPVPGPSLRGTVNREIRELARRAGLPAATADDLIDRGVDLAEARSTILADMMIRSRAADIRPSPHNMSTMDNPEARVRAMSDALYCRIAPSHRPSPAAAPFIGLSCAELAREVLRRNGITVTGLTAATVITRALHSTSDYPLLLADTMHKSLRAAYAAAPAGIRQLARETTNADFRRKSRLMLDSSGLKLEKVNEHGEFQSGSMAEAGESYKIDTFGRIFGITRQALVNDDLGAFADLTRRLGLAAAAFEAQFLVDLLVSNSGDGPVMSDRAALFDSTHGNKAGSGAAPSENTLSAARLAMRKQTAPAGGLIDVTPRFVVIPSDMETATEKLLTSIQAVTVDDVNPFSRLTLIVEPRLTDTKRWYVAADPATIDGLEFAYLAGAPGPQTESQAGFKVDGVEVKVRLDYGAGFVDHRGWYMNPGQ